MQRKIHVSEVRLWPKITPDRHHPSKGAVVSRCPGQNAKDTHQNHQSWPLPTPTMYSRDRKSTRLNSSHLGISYAVFCLKKKKNENNHLCTKQRSPSVPRQVATQPF